MKSHLRDRTPGGCGLLRLVGRGFYTFNPRGRVRGGHTSHYTHDVSSRLCNPGQNQYRAPPPPGSSGDRGDSHAAVTFNIFDDSVKFLQRSSFFIFNDDMKMVSLCGVCFGVFTLFRINIHDIIESQYLQSWLLFILNSKAEKWKGKERTKNLMSELILNSICCFILRNWPISSQRCLKFPVQGLNYTLKGKFLLRGKSHFNYCGWFTDAHGHVGQGVLLRVSAQLNNASESFKCF